MISLLAALTVLGTAGVDVAPARGTVSAGAPVRLWMNRDRVYREGEGVRLQVDTDVDGYLLVLNYDTDGRVRVLFPLDPRDDGQVRAGRRYEARNEEGGEAFIAGGDGTGLIYAAVSPEPWHFDQVVLDGRWDVSRLEIDRRSRNPEQDLTEVVQRIAGPKGFDYDVMGYRVYGERSYSTEVYPRGPIYVYDDGLYCNNWYWRYNGCRRWPYDGGWSFGANIFLGGYSPYFYDPFYYGYGYGYRPYGYGYGFGGYYPYYPFGTYSPSRPRAVIAGRSRGYTIRPLVPAHSAVPVGSGIISSGAARGGSEGGAPPINWRARGPADRPTREVGPRGPSRDPASFTAPPARRARPENLSFPAPRGRGYGAIERESGSREAPPRVERSGGSYSPPPRIERGSGSPPPARGGEPRHAAPPPRAESGGHGGGGGGGGGGHGGGGGGGRSRRP